MGKTTTKLAALSKQSSCFVDFDLELNEHLTEEARLTVSLNSDVGGLAIGLWAHCTSCGNVFSLSDSEKVIVSVSEDESLIIAVTG